MQRSATTFSSAGPRGLPCIRPKQRVSGSYKSCTFVVCKAGGNGVDPKADADKQREVTKMLLATQKNLLLINNSRVKMQEELAVANRKIQDLERELEKLRTEQVAADEKAKKELKLREAQLLKQYTSRSQPQPYQQPPQLYSQQTLQQQPPMQQQQQQPPPAFQQQQQQPQQQQGPPAPPPPPPAPPSVITLTYVSGWHNAFIHYSVDGKPWTQVPGVKLKQTGQDHNTKSIKIEGKKLEFVMNNGENDWDSPGRYTDKPKNYEISSPGNFRLKSGKVEKVQ